MIFTDPLLFVKNLNIWHNKRKIKPTKTSTERFIMKKLMLLVTLGIYNITYSSHYSYQQEAQRRHLPKALIMQNALQQGGQYTVAQQDNFLNWLAGKKYNFYTLEWLIDNERHYNPALKNLSDPDKQNTCIIIFETGTPVIENRIKRFRANL